MDRKCRECGKDFRVFPCRIKRGGGNYCSRSCSAKANHLKGIEIKCFICSRIRRSGRSYPRRGKFCSRECYETTIPNRMLGNRYASGKVAGDKNGNWNGGVTSLKNKIRKCRKYKKWASDVKKRDDFTCSICNKRGGALETDHYPKQFAKILAESGAKTFSEAMSYGEFWNTNNGRTLCKKCHSKETRKKAMQKYINGEDVELSSVQEVFDLVGS